jgi:hypothetical protein
MVKKKSRMENPTKVSTAFKKLPLDIIAFYLFAIVISAFSFYLRLDFNKELKASLMPYTGHGVGSGYLFLILAISVGLFSYRVSIARTLRNLRVFIIIFMLLDVYSGVEDWWQVTPGDYLNPNPYLRYDASTPVYTVGVPLFWALLMTGMLMYHYFKNKKENTLCVDTAA